MVVINLAARKRIYVIIFFCKQGKINLAFDINMRSELTCRYLWKQDVYCYANSQLFKCTSLIKHTVFDFHNEKNNQSYITHKKINKMQMITNSVFIPLIRISLLLFFLNCELPMTLFMIYRIHAYLTLNTSVYFEFSYIGCRR